MTVQTLSRLEMAAAEVLIGHEQDTRILAADTILRDIPQQQMLRHLRELMHGSFWHSLGMTTALRHGNDTDIAEHCRLLAEALTTAIASAKSERNAGFLVKGITCQDPLLSEVNARSILGQRLAQLEFEDMASGWTTFNSVFTPDGAYRDDLSIDDTSTQEMNFSKHLRLMFVENQTRYESEALERFGQAIRVLLFSASSSRTEVEQWIRAITAFLFAYERMAHMPQQR